MKLYKKTKLFPSNGGFYETLTITQKTQHSSNGGFYERLQQKITPKNGGTKQTMKLTVGINYGYGKLTTKECSAGGSLHCRLKDSMAWISVDKNARVSNMTDYNTLAQDKGDADYLSTRGAKGNRWKHFGNQGRQ